MNNKLERMWKEATMAYLKRFMLVWYWHGGSEEYHKMHQFLQPVFGLKFEPGISCVLSMSNTVSKIKIMCV